MLQDAGEAEAVSLRESGPHSQLDQTKFLPPDPPFYDDYEVTHLKQGHFRAALKSRKYRCKLKHLSQEVTSLDYGSLSPLLLGLLGLGLVLAVGHHLV